MNSAHPRRIAMIVFSHYPPGPRPRREAVALGAAGMEVDILFLRNENEAKKKKVNWVQHRDI